MGDAVLKGDMAPNTLEVYGCTDKGSVRPHNEDYFGHYLPPNIHIKNKWGSLFAISDGVGGSAAGEVASAEAVNVLLQEYYFGDHTERSPERLKSVYQFTAMHVFDLSNSHPSVRNMQCTLTALLIRQNKFFISHVGDSKVFLLRSQQLLQLTKDHTLVGKMVRLGLISPEAARTHPNKHVLLHALGEQPILPADFYSGNIQPGDLFILITDGILEHLTEEELKSFLVEKGYTDQGLKQLVNLINSRGGYDNMTIMTVKVNEIN